MALTDGQQAEIDRRRARVAQLVGQRYTQRQICDALAKEGFANGDTGDPYSLGTINSDVKALRVMWRREASADIQQHKADILAELEEVKRVAWEMRDLRAVIQAIKVKAVVVGLHKGVEAEQDDSLHITVTTIPSREAPAALLSGSPSAN